ncbi:hypothetical protein [Natronobiforma cellulositropha]|uniref:hypothetical protein n=1 Tax=Natronobiforma cellulositropha TaxID=1679076 RepID=UPI0021D59217|nr:hypothetical protein [Natronobiforma cellulositropha]
MATRSPVAQRDHARSPREGFSLAEAAVSTGAAAVFAVLFAPLFTYGFAISGYEVGSAAVVLAVALVGLAVSLLAQFRR